MFYWNRANGIHKYISCTAHPLPSILFNNLRLSVARRPACAHVFGRLWFYGWTYNRRTRLNPLAHVLPKPKIIGGSGGRISSHLVNAPASVSSTSKSEPSAPNLYKRKTR